MGPILSVHIAQPVQCGFPPGFEAIFSVSEGPTEGFIVLSKSERPKAKVWVRGVGIGPPPAATPQAANAGDFPGYPDGCAPRIHPEYSATLLPAR